MQWWRGSGRSKREKKRDVCTCVVHLGQIKYKYAVERAKSVSNRLSWSHSGLFAPRHAHTHSNSPPHFAVRAPVEFAFHLYYPGAFVCLWNACHILLWIIKKALKRAWGKIQRGRMQKENGATKSQSLHLWRIHHTNVFCLWFCHIC